MGRNKIKIEKISNERNRQVTFYKRKRGLLKKAMEISLLCEVKVMLCIVDKNEKVVLYSSEDLGNFLQKYVKNCIDSGNYVRTENYQKLFKNGKGLVEELDELEESNAENENNEFKEVESSIKSQEAKKEKSSFFKKEKNKSYLHLIEPEKEDNSKDTFQLQILKNKNKRKNDEVSPNHTQSISPSPSRSIYSAPPLNEKDFSVGPINRIEILEKSIQKPGIATPDSFFSHIDTSGNMSSNDLENALNPKNSQSKPSCFKKSTVNNSGGPQVTNLNLNLPYQNQFSQPIPNNPLPNMSNLFYNYNAYHPANYYNNVSNFQQPSALPFPFSNPFLNQKRGRENGNNEEISYQHFLDLFKNNILNQVNSGNVSNGNYNFENYINYENYFGNYYDTPQNAQINLNKGPNSDNINDCNNNQK